MEISNVCNLSCSFCPRSKREKTVMTREQFCHAISEIKPFCDFVYFHVKGEPLMHPDLEYFLKVCEENSLKVNITTNGTLLSEKKDILLFSSALRQLNVSVHSFEDKKLQQSYLENAVEFSKILAEKGVYAVLRLWNLSGERNVDEITKESIDYINRTLCPDIDLFEKMKEKRSVCALKNLFISFEEKFEWPSLESDHCADGYCHGARDQVAILSDGTVVPCCLDAEGVVNLGNVFKTPFSQIITSKRFTDIKNGFAARRAVEKLCKKCTFKSRFDIKI